MIEAHIIHSSRSVGVGNVSEVEMNMHFFFKSYKFAYG